MSSDPGTRNRWALLIGINEYPKLGPDKYLKGCVNDVEAMSRTLEERFEFLKDHLTILRDGEATRAGILAAMNELAGRAGRDDIVVFHYSGHGSRMTDREGDEADGMDETIVPYDSGRKTENRDITDDEIYDWLLDLTEVTPYVTLIFDCCHSGTIVRDAFGESSRWVEDDERPASQLPPSPITARTRSLLTDAAREVGTSGWLPVGERYILIAGCSSSESSYEVMLGEGGIRHGALTYCLLEELRQAGSGSTYLDVFEKVAPRVTGLYPRQHPQLEGVRDREIFGVQTIKPMTFVPVLGRDGDRVTLWAGATSGLTVGSLWVVHPPGTKKVEESEGLGKISITKVGAVTSEAAVVEGQAEAIGAGARAVELSHCLGETRLVVEVMAPSRDEAARNLQSLISQSPLLRLAREGETAAARVYLLSPRAGAREKDPAPALGALREETWAVVGGDGQLLMLPRRRGDHESVPAIVRNLEGRIRFQHTTALANPDSGLAGMVDLKLLRRLPGGTWGEPEPDADGEPVLFDGDPFILELTNRYDRPLHMYVLALGSGGTVDQLYPVLGAQEAHAAGAGPASDPSLLPALTPGHTIQVGLRRGEAMTIGFPEELASSWHLFGARCLEGRETFKLFATTQPADFRALLQPGYMRTKRGHALDDLLVSLGAGGGYREVKRAAPEDDWVTVQRSYKLKPRPRVVYRSAAG
jgi:Caspase domain